MLLAVSLAEKLGSKGLVAVSLHPGAIKTNLSSHLSLEEGLKSLSMAPKLLTNLIV